MPPRGNYGMRSRVWLISPETIKKVIQLPNARGKEFVTRLEKLYRNSL